MVGFYDRCVESLRADADTAAEGLCGEVASSGGIEARRWCWFVMGAKDMPEAGRARICSAATEKETVESLMMKGECWERVMWRGRSDRKYEIGPADAGTLCRHVGTRRDSEQVQTCWKERAFDSYRSTALRMPAEDAALVCSHVSAEQQQKRLLEYTAGHHLAKRKVAE